MPMSRARTAICSAPLECPSRPGLPTRIFGRRPSASPTRSTSSRSASRSSAAAPAAASPTPVGARRSPNASRRVPAHSPVVAPPRAAARGGLGAAGAPGVAGPLVAARARRRGRLALLLLERRVDGEDAAVGTLDERRALRGLEAVDADHDLLAGLD